jgi:hypothetical protein
MEIPSAVKLHDYRGAVDRLAAFVGDMDFEASQVARHSRETKQKQKREVPHVTIMPPAGPSGTPAGLPRCVPPCFRFFFFLLKPFFHAIVPIAVESSTSY